MIGGMLMVIAMMLGAVLALFLATLPSKWIQQRSIKAGRFFELPGSPDMRWVVYRDASVHYVLLQQVDSRLFRKPGFRTIQRATVRYLGNESFEGAIIQAQHRILKRQDALDLGRARDDQERQFFAAVTK